MDHRPIKPKTTELTGKNKGENLCELTVVFSFSYKIKAQSVKDYIDKSDFIKTENCSLNDTVKQRKRESQTGDFTQSLDARRCWARGLCTLHPMSQ